MKLLKAVERAGFFILGAMLIALAATAYFFDRQVYDPNLLICGLCSIGVGAIERSRDKGSLRGKSKA